MVSAGCYRRGVAVSEAFPPGTHSDGMVARAIAAAVPGEAAAAEAELYRRFAPRVRLYGLRHLRDHAAADDLMQQVLVVVIERLRAGAVAEPDQIGSFVLGTSRMIAGSIRRVERRRQSLRDRFDVRSQAVVGVDESSIDERRIAPCLAAARERERTILLLTFYADKSAPDIARALGMTPGAVRVARHRALDAMRACLDARRPA
jgi:RNA polymerase sigma-70 factor (ECF subfamily)